MQYYSYCIFLQKTQKTIRLQFYIEDNLYIKIQSLYKNVSNINSLESDKDN